MTTPPPPFVPGASESDAVPLVAAPSSIPRAFPVRRLVIMAATVLIVLLGVNAFVCATASHFFGLPGWPRWQRIPGSMPVAFIAATVVGFNHSNPLLRLIYAISATALGALNYAFFAALCCWICLLPNWLAGEPLSRPAVGSFMFGVALLVTIYGVINASWLRVTRVTVRLPHLPESWRGLEVALVTDIHLGHISGPRFLRRIIARLQVLKPEAILLSGDLFDGTTVDLDHLVAPWRTCSAPRGIFYVTGNHDEFAERSIYLEAVRRTGIRVLNNEKVVVDGLQVVGIHDGEASEPAEFRRLLRAAQIDPRQPSILLAHQPANLAVAEEAGISLQLSGHTHRGQLWPWTLLVHRIYGRFAYGLHRLNTMQVYTSSGAGAWGPPLRVGTKSEIVLLRLEAA